MKNVISLTIFLMVISILYVGLVYGQNGKKVHEAKGELTKPEKMASKLWNKMQTDDYQNTWKMWPGRTAFYKGTPPHGALLTTYLNSKAYNAIEKKEKELPYRSIIIKENYMPDKKLGAITVMKRVKGFNPDAGDWFWVKFAPDGKPMTMEKDGMTMSLAGKVPGCIGCHTASTGGIKYIMTQ
ncbi:cytochrome P460 family protein [Desulfobacterota bacterium AH_259_B03_O07]|nr:cytochrome P460 family protein [Desulfobacterota bacterium AH_259_B03_O07]